MPLHFPLLFLRFALFATVLLSSAALPANGQANGSASFSTAGTTPAEVKLFLGKLQRAVVADDRSAVAALVAFPLRAWTGRATVAVRDRKQFLKLYPSIFTPALKQSVAAASADSAWCNWQGVMFDSGRFWLGSNAENQLRLTTINEPTP
jgi:hypothetical protein